MLSNVLFSYDSTQLKCSSPEMYLVLCSNLIISYVHTQFIWLNIDICSNIVVHVHTWCMILVHYCLGTTLAALLED